MDNILAGHQGVWNILGRQTYNGNLKYKYSLYTLSLEVSEGYLLYNDLTKQLILLDKAQYETPTDGMVKYLVEQWFMTPEYTDDYGIFYTVYQAYKTVNKRKTYGKINLCTIFPTTGCNAQCPYCYEKGMESKNMSEQVADDLVAWLKTRTASTLHVKWFGGEPLCNKPIIDRICQRLQVENIDFYSSITTNGLLFEEDEVDKYINQWHLRQAQVTIDGTHDVYIATKNFKSFTGDAYEKVLSNVEMLSKAGVRVNIRTHITGENKQDILALVDELTERYKNNSRVIVYTHPLYEGCGEIETFSDEERALVYRNYREVSAVINATGAGPRYSIERFRTTHCMADDGRSMCVNPDGGLSLCEHHPWDELYGNIYDDNYDKAILDSWLEPAIDSVECIKCCLRPSCLRLAKCPVDEICTAQTIEYKLNKTYLAMTNAYSRYKQNTEKIE